MCAVELYVVVDANTPVQDPVEEIPRVAKHIQQHEPIVVPAISEGFRIGCVPCPPNSSMLFD